MSYICVLTVKRSHFDYIARIVLFVVYASFFVVQSFFIVNNNYQSPFPVVSAHHASEKVNTTHPSLSAKKETGKHPASRLNRRFQPQDLLSFIGTDLRAPVSFTVMFTSSKPTGHLLISSILADSLRGPPAIG